jgi:hypothetical protein
LHAGLTFDLVSVGFSLAGGSVIVKFIYGSGHVGDASQILSSRAIWEIL